MNNYILIFLIFILIIFYSSNKKNKELFSINLIHPLNKFFDKVYVISLPKRREYMNNLMNKNNIKFKLIDALTPDNTPKDYLYNNNYISNICSLNNGRIYCHMSHIKVMNDIINNNYKNAFIFEDDIDNDNFNINNFNNLSKILKNIPKDYDIFYLGKCWDIKNKNVKVNDYVYKPFKPLCRHAYGVTNRCAKKIVKYTLPMTIFPGDQMYVQLIKNKIINAYSSYEQIFTQNRKKFGSNLGNDQILVNNGPPTYTNNKINLKYIIILYFKSMFYMNKKLLLNNK